MIQYIYCIVLAVAIRIFNFNLTPVPMLFALRAYAVSKVFTVTDVCLPFDTLLTALGEFTPVVVVVVNMKVCW